MKKLLWLSLLLSVLFARHSFAAPNFNATEKGNTVTASLSGGNTSSSYRLLIQTTPFSSNFTPSSIPSAGAVDPTVKKPDSTGSITWTVSEHYNTTYYVRAIEIPKSLVTTAWVGDPVTVKTDQQTLYFTPLTTSTQSGKLIVQGNLNPSKQTNYLQYKITLAYSRSADMSNPVNAGMKSLTGPDTDLYSEGISDGQSEMKDSSRADAKVYPAGNYYWVLSGLTPGVTYYMQQTITDPDGNVTVDKAVKFNGTDGIVVGNTASTSTNLNTSSYTLLTPLPGLTSVPSAADCAAEQAAATAKGQNPPLCSVNDLLNYALKLLIGICGVVLVLRLMFEGYQYMVTDVPFLKASSKAGFFTALTGLLLALSSYVILNTINPKLVDETVNIQQLAIGVTALDVDSVPQTQNASAPTGGAAGACTSGIVSVKIQKSSFLACSTYNGIPIASNLTKLLTDAYAAGYTITGGGFRSSAEQTQLRKDHCNGDLYNSKAVCNPPTAPVGHSNHESGLAFDLQCNGGSAYDFGKSACFTWMNQNASKYALKNFYKEPWHWSWNGN
ncbi:MAG TPA: M15 family metallopeptidase [Candidatus Paceibacterota bacterium]|jgi:hypothetical protein|nr:M15 family metallopeptidase [Candidatus Paceibacterota bacterium]